MKKFWIAMYLTEDAERITSRELAIQRAQAIAGRTGRETIVLEAIDVCHAVVTTTHEGVD